MLIKMKRVELVSTALIIASSALWAACGGASSTDAFTLAQDAGGTADATNGDGSVTTLPDGAASNDGAIASDAAPATDGSVAVRDGGPFTDAAPTIVADGGAGNTGSPGGNTSQLACGTASCQLATDFCCVYANNNPPPDFSFLCATGSACPAVAGAQDPAALACSSAANCPASTVCCVKSSGNRVWSECAASCADTAGVATAQLCDPTAAVSGCSAQRPCSSQNIGDWGLPTGFATCGGRGN